jgi:hypothetical protein
MEYAIGIIVAAAVGAFGTVVGFDKERSFYPVVLIVIAGFSTNAGVPLFWPGFCLAYDIVAAAYCGGLIVVRGQHQV